VGIVHFDEAKVSVLMPIIRKMIDVSGDIEVTEKIDGVNIRAGVVGGRFYTSTKRGSKVFDVDVPTAYDVDFLKQFADVHEKLSGSNFVDVVRKFTHDNSRQLSKLIEGFDPNDCDVELTFEFVGARSNVIAYDPLHVGSGALIILDITVDGESVSKSSLGGRIMDVLKSQLSSGLKVHTMLVHDLKGLKRLSVDVVRDFGDIERELAGYGSRVPEVLQGRAKTMIDAIRTELVSNWVDLQAANFLGGTEIEGLVIKDRSSGELVKIVNRDKFTKRLRQLWTFRNAANIALTAFQQRVARDVFGSRGVITDLITVTTAPNFKKRHGDITVAMVDAAVRSNFNVNAAAAAIDELELAVENAWIQATAVHNQLTTSGVSERVVSDNVASEQAQRASLERQVTAMREAVAANDAVAFVRIVTPRSRWQKKLIESAVKRHIPITEGGTAFDSTTSITREQYASVRGEIFDLMRSLGASDVREIGSTGKKAVMGDVDIAVDITKDRRDAVIAELGRYVGSENVRRVGSSIVSFAFKVDASTFVQVDIMLSQHVDYVAWARSGTSNIPEHPDYSRAKAVYRNMLVNSVARASNELSVIDAREQRVGYLVDRDEGLFIAKRVRTNSRSRPWKVIERQLVSVDPREITEHLFGSDVSPGDVNTLERLVGVIKTSSKTRAHADEIFTDFARSIRDLTTYDKRFSTGEVESVIALTNEGYMRGIGIRMGDSSDQAIKLVEKASLGGFEYEYTVLGAIKQAGISGAIKTPAGASAVAPDADIRIDGEIYPVEVKLNKRAQMGGGSIKWQYGVVGVDFTKSMDPVIEAVINEAMKTKVNALVDFVDFIREYDGNDDFWGWPGTITRESWDAAQQQGLLAALQINIPYDVSFITKHYAKKGIRYIQIGDAGMFYLASNPARLPVPKLTGEIEIEIRAARDSTKVRRDGLAVVGTGLRVQARLKAKGQSPYSLDDMRSIKAMLAARDQREGLARDLLEIFPVVTI
jgi:hypothetical protein